VTRLLGVFDLAFGLLFVAFGILAAFGVPTTFAEYVNEPERFWGVVIALLLCIWVGGVALVAGWSLISRAPIDLATGSGLRFALYLNSVLLTLLIVLAFMWDDPSRFVALSFLLPSVAFIATGWQLAKND